MLGCASNNEYLAVKEVIVELCLSVHISDYQGIFSNSIVCEKVE